MTPKQEIYTAIKLMCMEAGLDVYDRRPDDAEYPFVDMGEQFGQGYWQNKDRMTKTTQVTVHVWHNDWRKRGTLTRVMGIVEGGMKRLTKTSRLSLRLNTINTQNQEDNTTGTTLLHGVVEASYTYQRRN